MTIQRVNPGWGTGAKLTSDQTNALDLNTTYALDKRAGQTDTLASQVSVDGTGRVSLDAATALIRANASGAKIAATAAGALIRTETGGRIELGDNDYPTLATGHTGRTVVRRVPAGTPSAQGERDDNVMSSSSPLTFVGDVSGGSVRVTRSLATLRFAAVDNTTTSTPDGVLYDLTPYIVDGATITRVDVTLKGAASHAGMPAKKPCIAVGRFGGSSEVDSVLHSSGSSIPDPSTDVTTYQASHTITATCDTNNVVTKNQAHYYLTVMNEGGTNALLGLTVSKIIITQTITDLRPS